MPRTVIIGAGPAGLATAYELSRLGLPAVVLEKDSIVGGIARTVNYKGYRFDIGGHRFFSHVPEIRAIWQEILGEDFLERPRLSRIYYEGKFFDYPLRPLKALRSLGVLESIRVMLSYLWARAAPHRNEKSFEEWVSNRFGRRLYEIFFKTYTEKVWGVPGSEISADWASQRIQNLDLMKALRAALLNKRGGELAKTLIDRFHYPRHGPGMMWERCQELLEEKGVETRLGLTVTAFRHRHGRVRSVLVSDRHGREWEEEGDEFVSSMPLALCIRALDPPPPQEILAAARSLRYRDFLTVLLIVDREHVFPDNWIYIHSSEVRVGRVQNFKNWSPEMVPDPTRTALGLEYFVNEGDDLWSASDADLVALATREMETLGLCNGAEILDGTVFRMPKAYPVYDDNYSEAVSTIRVHLEGLENLQTIGRNGQHRYNNQDHSMMTGLLAARNVAGASHDIWTVNVDSAYHEGASERGVPARLETDTLEQRLREVFARYDPIALGTALGALSGGGLFLATAVLLLKGGDPVGPTLSLLGSYFLGFSATWPGAFVGMIEGALGGFLAGLLLARGINLLVGAHETSLRRRLQLSLSLDPLEEPSPDG